MDNRKIAFIICVNNNRLYSEAEIYIRNLNIPKGFKVEIVPIYKAESITSGYNYGMKNYRRVEEALFKSMSFTTVFSILCLVITLIFSRELSGIFVKDEINLTYSHVDRIIAVITPRVPLATIPEPAIKPSRYRSKGPT